MSAARKLSPAARLARVAPGTHPALTLARRMGWRLHPQDPQATPQAGITGITLSGESIGVSGTGVDLTVRGIVSTTGGGGGGGGDKPDATNTGYSGTLGTFTQIGVTYANQTWLEANATGSGTAQDPWVIEHFHVTGTLVIEEDYTTVRNCYVDGAFGERYGIDCDYRKPVGTVIEDCEITQTNSAMVYGPTLTIRRCNLHHGKSDGFKPSGSDCIMEDSYIHHLGMGTDAHADGVQARNAAPGTTWTGHIYRRNNFDMPGVTTPGTQEPYVEGGQAYKHNAAIYLQVADGGAIHGAISEYNWMNGGGFTYQCRGGNGNANHILRYNRFGRYYSFGPIYDTTSNPTYLDNVWDDTGELAVANT